MAPKVAAMDTWRPHATVRIEPCHPRPADSDRRDAGADRGSSRGGYSADGSFGCSSPRSIAATAAATPCWSSVTVIASTVRTVGSDRTVSVSSAPSIRYRPSGPSSSQPVGGRSPARKKTPRSPSVSRSSPCSRQGRSPAASNQPRQPGRRTVCLPARLLDGEGAGGHLTSQQPLDHHPNFHHREDHILLVQDPAPAGRSDAPDGHGVRRGDQLTDAVVVHGPVPVLYRRLDAGRHHHHQQNDCSKPT